MGVKAFEQDHRLIDNARSLPCGQRFGLGKEPTQSDAGFKQRPDSLVGFLQDSSRNYPIGATIPPRCAPTAVSCLS
jgi:hypothetical protein